ncbi:hypothetical protein TI39_contig491g00014 [Zymoseptoria brevis]|uniref:Uncharacterized protein n=1 Tax=Zymoseptoria brevis TaxID=1047168 RepID=A0A0F4GK43_9PEZI|nr:hypothetical protein TI39_contig491g00014 [Zymoseptoria brevis]
MPITWTNDHRHVLHLLIPDLSNLAPDQASPTSTPVQFFFNHAVPAGITVLGVELGLPASPAPPFSTLELLIIYRADEYAEDFADDFKLLQRHDSIKNTYKVFTFTATFIPAAMSNLIELLPLDANAWVEPQAGEYVKQNCKQLEVVDDMDCTITWLHYLRDLLRDIAAQEVTRQDVRTEIWLAIVHLGLTRQAGFTNVGTVRFFFNRAVPAPSSPWMTLWVYLLFLHLQVRQLTLRQTSTRARVSHLHLVQAN